MSNSAAPRLLQATAQLLAMSGVIGIITMMLETQAIGNSDQTICVPIQPLSRYIFYDIISIYEIKLNNFRLKPLWEPHSTLRHTLIPTPVSGV